MTPIQNAIIHRFAEGVEILAPFLSISSLRSAVRLAIVKGYPEIVEILISGIEEPNGPDKRGLTPIHYAITEGRNNPETLRVLTKQYFYPYHTEPKTGLTALQIAVQLGYTEGVKILAPFYDDPNTPGQWVLNFL